MKTTFWKTLLALLLVLLMICGLLSGCAASPDGENSPKDTSVPDTTSSDGKVHLHVVAEEYDLRSIYVSALAELYNIRNKDVVVEVELIPADVTLREPVLSRIRTEILAGQGPDIFVLPTYPMRRTRLHRIYQDPLIPDVAQSMRNLVFADISALYEADQELNKEELQADVMEAGVLDGARYVLPLQYNMPMLYLDRAGLETTGLDVDALTENIDSYLTTLINSNNGKQAATSNTRNMSTSFGLDFFPELLDYENESVNVTTDEMSDYLEKIQKIIYLRGDTTGTGSNGQALSDYIRSGKSWHDFEHYIHVSDLFNADDYQLIAKAQGWELDMVPLRNFDNQVVANVTYWTGINANCDNIEAAYEFVRQLLLKSFQTEHPIPKRLEKNFYQSFEFILESYTDGWPVRMIGTGDEICSIAKSRFKGFAYDGTESEIARADTIYPIILSDEDFPFINEKIDVVLFSFPYEEEFVEVVDSLNNPADVGATPTNVDIDKLAKDIIWNLQLHLGEG